jgi:hypothetical protein
MLSCAIDALRSLRGTNMKRAEKLTTLPAKYEPGFLRRMDRRTEISQRLQAAYDTVVRDCGGFRLCSHVKLALIERFIFLEAMLQSWELMIVQNPKAASELIGRWVQASNAIQGLAVKIGIERSPVATPAGLKAYVQDKKA